MNQLKTYRRLWAELRPQKRRMAKLILATMVYGATGPIIPLVMRPLLDGGFISLSTTTVHAMVLLLIAGFVVRGAGGFFAGLLSVTLSQNLILRLRAALFAKTLRLPMRYYLDHNSGEILSRFSYDVLQLQQVASEVFLNILRDSITMLALVLCLFYLNAGMTLAVLVLTPLLAVLIARVARKIRHLAQALQEDMGAMNHRLEEVVHGRELVRLAAGEAFERARFAAVIDRLRCGSIAAARVALLGAPLVELIIVSALSVVILYAAHLAHHHPQAMTPGTFVAYLSTMILLATPVKRLSRIVEPLQRGETAAVSIFAFLDLPEDAPLGNAGPKLRGAISMQKLAFAYGKAPVFCDFSLEIAAGETVALVGASGSGKSTLMALLAGFYTPDQGQIYFDGQALSLAARRENLAMVRQETVIFSASVAENVAYPHPPEALRVRAALEAANAWEFVAQLPQGIDTPLGAQGLRLSGGQRQRIAIARALYKDAPILIFDEATSALDNHAEAKVQAALAHLKGQRTLILIAHRLSSVRLADRIVVLEQGRIAEMGSEAELLAAGGLYAKLSALAHPHPHSH